MMNPYVFFGAWGGALFALIGAVGYFYFELKVIEAWGMAISIAALAMMGLDKSLARSGSLRMPELVAFVVAALGGSPGVLIGMHLFKHKTRKASFLLVLLIIFVVQLAALSRLAYQL